MATSKKYSWCIPVQKEIKPIIWGAAITPEPWNRQQCWFIFEDPNVRVARLLESLATMSTGMKKTIKLTQGLSIVQQIFFVHFFCQFYHFCRINARKCFHPDAHRPMPGMLKDFIVFWHSLWCALWSYWTMVAGKVAVPKWRVPNPTTELKYGNEDLCRVPGHATKASIVFSGTHGLRSIRPLVSLLRTPSDFGTKPLILIEIEAKWHTYVSKLGDRCFRYMTCRLLLLGAMPLSAPMLCYYYFSPWEYISMKFESK